MTIFCPNGHENSETNRFCQACGSSIVLPATNHPTIGVLLGDRYRITAEIGQGGFGRTYLCEDTNRFNELCVLKEFAPQVQGTALLNKAQELFEREAGVMYRLQHPQIPMFREMFRVNSSGVGQLFLVQDFVDGVNYQGLLRQKLKQGQQFTEAEITEFLKRILPVLGYIHSLGVIHRDISPDNLIQRKSDGLPVLIDFGGVKQVAVNAVNEATQHLSASGNSDLPTRLGKVGYAPNEQMQRGVVMPHSDLYALAATSLVLLTGKEPPDLIDPQNFTWNWREHISLSPTLAGVLDRMLQLRPNDRFESAQAVLSALETGDGIAPVLPSKPSGNVAKSSLPTFVVGTTEKSSNPSGTKTTATEPGLLGILGKTWLIIAALIGAIGCGWGVASWLGGRSNPSSTPTVPTPSQPTTSETSLPTPTATTTPASVSTTPNKSTIATIPATLASKGINERAYEDAVKQVFIGQNPNATIQTGDDRVRAKLDAISADLGNKLTARLNDDAIQRIGKYKPSSRVTWKSQVNKLNLSERSLIDLTDAKYRSITEFSAQKLGIGVEPFLNTALGQVYLATMFDRLQAIQAKRALDEIVFPVGGTVGTASGTLQPGEGKAYIASLSGGQAIGVNITANEPTNLSIYPHSTNLPALLTTSSTKNWSGKTSTNGYHEVVLVSHSDRPVRYELKLTAADLNPTNVSNTKSKPANEKPLW